MFRVDPRLQTIYPNRSHCGLLVANEILKMIISDAHF